MTHANAICWFCGLFMSYQQMADGIEWLPFGSPESTEPPDPENAHKSCWSKAREQDRALIRSTSYCGPNCARELV